MKERFVVFKGYKLDKVIFRSMLALLFIVVIYVLLSSKTYFSFECPASSPGFCETDYIKPLCEDSPYNRLIYGDLALQLENFGLCNGEQVIPGFKFTYGKPPSPLVRIISNWLFLLPLLAVAVNHFRYNKDYGKEGGVL